MELDGRVALVTGGNRGIGRAIALALAEGGADVAIVYRRDEEAAAATVKEIARVGREAAAYQADVGLKADYDVARAVQGVGGALLVPGSLAIISASFDEDRHVVVVRLFHVDGLGSCEVTLRRGGPVADQRRARVQVRVFPKDQLTAVAAARGPPGRRPHPAAAPASGAARRVWRPR